MRGEVSPISKDILGRDWGLFYCWCTLFENLLSFSYKCEWKLEEAQKNILRTHTTAVSARMLYKLGQQEKFEPVKYFSIDRVFRNEALDATHLAEFHQIEGVVADYNLTLGDLMGLLNEFFLKMGNLLFFSWKS